MNLFSFCQTNCLPLQRGIAYVAIIAIDLESHALTLHPGYFVCLGHLYKQYTVLVNSVCCIYCEMDPTEKIQATYTILKTSFVHKRKVYKQKSHYNQN